MSRLPLSAVLITLNAARELPACLAALSFVDEIVVVDSGSTDGTLDLAAKAGARVIQQSWLGFGPQKQFAVSQAKHDWVLCIDADEIVSERLKNSIETVMQKPDHLVYRMARANRFLGRYLYHGEGYPDWSLRLFDRRQVRWSDDSVHEKVLTGGHPVATLAGDLLHHSAEQLDVYLTKQNRYTTLQAEALHKRGKRVGWRHIVLSPLLRFFKFYIVRRGFMDGLPGLVHVSIGCFNSFIKYSKAYALQQEQKE